MSSKDFFQALVNATNSHKLKWAVLPKIHYSKVTNISTGMVDAFYTEYKDDTVIVAYQYKSEYENEDISYYISICDKNFNFKYEFTQNELNAFGSDMFKFYKNLQRLANNIDDFMENFINEYNENKDIPF